MAVNFIKQRQSGFTLIEMLVVMAIIGIISCGAALSVSGGAERRLTAEAERLHDSLQLAADQAVLSGTEFGVYITRNSYGFLYYDLASSQWKSYQSGVFRLYRLPDNLSLSLQVEHNDIPLGNPEKTKNDTPRPMLLFLSSGERAPFLLTLHDIAHGKSLSMITDGFSPVTLVAQASK